jgi:hypothetical protein
MSPSICALKFWQKGNKLEIGRKEAMVLPYMDDVIKASLCDSESLRK